ncbi:phage holin family protein [Virgibacillus salexigens]|uniref:Holin, phage phi LC3 family n=1 Tax=Virgibacillus massiliensis TaxID=1462526 RepID=A0A024QAQ3_9BACI|nr:phage holin family protein [Virgibacillus massiliensis]CDQ39564.1 holin, phage phi LC3 family [Virgibacillus massiliensis]
MKNINWKVRFSNPVFLAQLVLSVLAPITLYFGITYEELNTWGKLGQVLFDAVRNPYVLSGVAVSVYNAVNDPTTAGVIKDSIRAQGYEKPKKDVR